MKKLLLIILIILETNSFSQVVLENYPLPATSILQATNFINMNGKMYYFGRNPSYQWSLYSTDGSDTGNQIVKNLGLQVANIMSQSDFDAKFNDYKIVYNNKLYFTVNGQLWQSDGSTAGTNVFSNAITPIFYKIFNGKLYFTAYNTTGGQEVWSSDGTVAGTSMLLDIYPGSNPSVDTSRDPHFTIFNNKLFFVANDGTNGYELWSTDGSSAGTALFMNIRVTESESNAYSQGAFTVTSTYSKQPFAVFNNKMYFVANSDFTNQYGFQFRLFQTDGTVTGTTYVTAPIDFSICNCTAESVNLFDGKGFTITNNEMIFYGGSIFPIPSIPIGFGIYKINTTDQISKISNSFYTGDLGSGPDTEQGAMKLFNGDYYFIGPGATSSSNPELCKMNPATFAITQVSAPASQSGILFNDTNDSTRFLLSQEWNGRLYFMKATSIAGQLFSTTGTLASTTQVTRQTDNSLNMSPVIFGNSAPRQLNNFGSGLYFSANLGNPTPSVWRFYDSTLATNQNTISKFTIFPNPTNNNLNLKFEDNLENATLKIISITGQTVLEKQNLSGTDFNFDVSNLNSGMYIIQIADGNKILYSKFLKQ